MIGFFRPQSYELTHFYYIPIFGYFFEKYLIVGLVNSIRFYYRFKTIYLKIFGKAILLKTFLLNFVFKMVDQSLKI